MKNKLLHLLGVAGLMLALASCGGGKGGNNEGDSTQATDSSQTSKTMNTTNTNADVHTFAQADKAVMTDLALDIKVDFNQKCRRSL